jgi:hypothetical protein
MARHAFADHDSGLNVRLAVCCRDGRRLHPEAPVGNQRGTPVAERPRTAERLRGRQGCVCPWLWAAPMLKVQQRGYRRR